MSYESKYKREDIDELFEAILTLRDQEDCYRFFEDLCTSAELKAMSQRLVVAKMLNENKQNILAVRGNCDSEVDQMVLNFPVLADYAFIERDGLRIFATHGHVHNMEKCPPLMKGDILLHGHTHIPAWERFGEENLYLNPGSASIPKAGSANSYMVLEDGTFLWKTLDGVVYHSEVL